VAEEKVIVQRRGIGFLGLLAIVFITLKLTGYIAWSWWFVLAPLWVPFGIFLLVMGVIIGMALFALAVAKLLESR
jgi:hypothetical protein